AKAAKPDLKDDLIRMKLRDEQRESALHNLSNTVEDELAAGKPFHEALSKAGITSAPKTMEHVTADMAKTSSNEVSKTVAEQGFGLGEGEISGLISTKGGTTLMVVVKSITPATPKPYDEVKADVKARVGKQLARDAARAKAVTIKDAISKAPNWQAVTNEQ